MNGFKSIQQDIKLLSMDLDIEEQSDALTCPFCNGGGKDTSFYVRRLPNVLLYYCHRASCGQRGVVPVQGQAHYQRLNKEVRRIQDRTHRQFDKPLGNLPRSVALLLREGYGVEPHDYGFRWTGERVYMPVRDYFGHDLGCILRFYPRKDIAPFCKKARIVNRYREELRTGEPKADTYRYYGNDKPFAAWYPHVGDDYVVLVEDQVSACKLHTCGISSIALCGVHVSTYLATEVAQRYKNVVIALDADATARAHKLWTQFKLLFHTCKVQTLAKDVKDMDTDEIKEMFL